jgi:hypothetical protein
MKGTNIIYGRQTWGSLMDENIYNEIPKKEIIKTPEYKYIEF